MVALKSKSVIFATVINLMKLCNYRYIPAPQPKLDSLICSLRARLARYNILCKGSSIYSTPPSKAYNDCDNTVLMLRLTFVVTTINL